MKMIEIQLSHRKITEKTIASSDNKDHCTITKNWTALFVLSLMSISVLTMRVFSLSEITMQQKYGEYVSSESYESIHFHIQFIRRALRLEIAQTQTLFKIC